MKKVIFDIDGVVADFEGGLNRELLRKFGDLAVCDRSVFSLEKRYSGDVLEYAQKLTNDPNFYYSIQPIFGATDFITELEDRGFDVEFCSSRPESATTFTRRWLRGAVGGNHDLNCGIRNKARFLGGRTDILFAVEDNPTQIENLKSVGIFVYCWDSPWNEGIFPRLYVRSDGELMCWENSSKESSLFFGEERN